MSKRKRKHRVKKNSKRLLKNQKILLLLPSERLCIGVALTIGLKTPARNSTAKPVIYNAIHIDQKKVIIH